MIDPFELFPPFRGLACDVGRVGRGVDVCDLLVEDLDATVQALFVGRAFLRAGDGTETLGHRFDHAGVVFDELPQFGAVPDDGEQRGGPRFAGSLEQDLDKRHVHNSMGRPPFPVYGRESPFVYGKASPFGNCGLAEVP